MTDCCCSREPGAEHVVGCPRNPSMAREYAQHAYVVALTEAYDELREGSE